MGATQSFVSTESIATVAVIAGAAGVAYTTARKNAGDQQTANEIGQGPGGGTTQKSKKKKKKQGSVKDDSADASIPIPVKQASASASTVLPGQFEPGTPVPQLLVEDLTQSTTSTKPKKAKKKKATKNEPSVPASSPERSNTPSASATKPASSSRKPSSNAPAASSKPRASEPLDASFASIDTDGSWTRVGSTRRARGANGGGATSADGTSAWPEATTSDAGISTSANTGTSSSPVVEALELSDNNNNDNGDPDADASSSTRFTAENRRTLAEKLLPKPRKTGVADMLETPDHPTIARVIRIQPLPHEKPAQGFSWGDYEDVRADGGENDADGEDDGWGVVKSKRSTRTPRVASTSNPAAAVQQRQQQQPETLTKRQRQNAQRREKEKAEKAEVEKQRLATLAKHKRELEKAKIMEQYKSTTGSKTLGGGMKSSVDERGKLVWE